MLLVWLLVLVTLAIAVVLAIAVYVAVTRDEFALELRWLSLCLRLGGRKRL